VKKIVMLNLFQNRKIEADEHRSCDPETSSGWRK